MANVRRFLREDLGRRGDVTTRLVLGSRRQAGRARVFARERVVAAGLSEAAAVFLHHRCKVRIRAHVGHWVGVGAPLLDIHGPVAGILSAERVALNILGRMCGIATETRRLVEVVRRANPRCTLAATRKTTPGFREYEKRAVAIGGGETHRHDLSSGILIKDNHLTAVGSVRKAVERARRNRYGLPVEVEVSRLRDALEAVDAGAHWLLLDNVPPARAKTIARAARDRNPAIRIEVSGGLTAARLAKYAPHADRLSMGRLTHSARSADVTLDLEVPKR